MRTLVRKFNYTGRSRIPKERVKIVQFDSNGVKAFHANFDFSSLGLPGTARIFVEPYFKSSFMRFDFGTVDNVVPPPTTDLVEIPPTERMLYRVKIVDTSTKAGLILASAEELHPESSDKATSRTSLLPIDFNDLGYQVWKLEFRDEGPVLSVNHAPRIEQIREIVQSQWFITLVYPEVVRQIVHKILTDDESSIDEPFGWVEQWLRYFREVLYCDIKSTQDPDEHERIAESIVDAFCKRNNVSKLISDAYARSQTK
jgi:hypothetical protein